MICRYTGYFDKEVSMKAVTLTESGLKPAVQHSETTCACNKIFVALSVIAALGLFLASAIGGVGLFMQSAPQWIASIGPIGQWVMLVGGGLLGAGAAGYGFYGICKKETHKEAHKEADEVYHSKPKGNIVNPAKAAVFQATQQTYKVGCYMNAHGVRCDFDNSKMIEGTQIVRWPQPINKDGSYKTQFCVKEDDTLNVLLKLSAKYKDRGLIPAGINMANGHHPGGGVERGCSAQEEEICRRSNHYLGLTTQNYPLEPCSVIYCPDVVVFREDEKQDYAFMDSPRSTALVAVAALDLREGSEDRKNLNLPAVGNLTDDELSQNKNYTELTKTKIRHTLNAMYSNGHVHIVLGALGCGAFQNPPQVVARLFADVFKEKEFAGAFQEVHFAILRLSNKDQANIDAFNQICKELNKS